MHISEGILSPPVLIAGMASTAIGTAIGLRKLNDDAIPRTAVLSASFFVASLIHVPIGPSSAHLILNGMVGLILGWGAFPAILAALVLQAVLFQFGGITTLGVNTIIMALPAVVCYWLFSSFLKRETRIALAAAFACGILSVFFSAVLVGLSLAVTEKGFLKVAYLVVATHLPVMLIEGMMTAFCVAFLKKVKPGMLPGDGNSR